MEACAGLRSHGIAHGPEVQEVTALLIDLKFNSRQSTPALISTQVTYGPPVMLTKAQRSLLQLGILLSSCWEGQVLICR